MESYKLSMQTYVVLFSSMLVLCETFFNGWLSYIYIHKCRCRGVDGTRTTPGMGFFAKTVKGLKPLTVFAESSVFGFWLVSAMLLYMFSFSM